MTTITHPWRTLVGRARPRTRDADGGRYWVRWTLANGLVVGVVALWWWASSNTTEAVLPGPIAVVEATWRLVAGDLRQHLFVSLYRVVLAVAVAMLIGGGLIVGARLVPDTEPAVTRRILPFMNSMPALGWAILGIVWFGVGNFSVAFILVAVLVPFAMVNMAEGVRNIDRDLTEMGRSFTRRKWPVVRRIELPLLVPYVFAAARLSFGVGFKVALIAEFFGAREGLGLVMNRARQTFDMPVVFGAVLAVVLVVFVIERLVFEPVARRLAHRSGSGAPVRTAVEA